MKSVATAPGRVPWIAHGPVADSQTHCRESVSVSGSGCALRQPAIATISEIASNAQPTQPFTSDPAPRSSPPGMLARRAHARKPGPFVTLQSVRRAAATRSPRCCYPDDVSDSDGQHFQRILVPVDFQPADDEATEAGRAVVIGGHGIEFSPASLRAVGMAATIARASKGKIVLVHVTPAMQSTSMYTGPVTLPAAIIEEIESKARATSQGALRHLADQHCAGLPVEFAIGPGHPAQCVLEEAVRTQADLIVMAASGRSRVARFFVGSTADRVIREAPCPVLVIPAR